MGQKLGIARLAELNEQDMKGWSTSFLCFNLEGSAYTQFGGGCSHAQFNIHLWCG
jgi:hypothetical protein